MKKSERFIQYGVTTGAWFVIGLFVFLFFFICHEGLPVGEETDWLTFLLSRNWNPLGNPPELGIFPMICGSLYVSLLAVLLAVPVGAGCALFLSFFVAARVRDILLAFIDMLAGVPSVIFGFIGLTVVVNRIGRIFELASGESILAAALVLAVMLLPFVVSTCVESIGEVRRLYEGTSLALGVDMMYFIRRLVLPYMQNAVIGAWILSFARAAGETMAVMMVLGNAVIMPELLGKGESVPSLIALEMGSAEYGSLHYSALYAAGAVLLFLLLLSGLLLRVVQHKKRSLRGC